MDGLHIYHALQCTAAAGINSVNALLPLFHDKHNGNDLAFTQCHKSSSLAHKPGTGYSCNS